MCWAAAAPSLLNSDNTRQLNRKMRAVCIQTWQQQLYKKSIKQKDNVCIEGIPWKIKLFLRLHNLGEENKINSFQLSLKLSVRHEKILQKVEVNQGESYLQKEREGEEERLCGRRLRGERKWPSLFIWGEETTVMGPGSASPPWHLSQWPPRPAQTAQQKSSSSRGSAGFLSYRPEFRLTGASSSRMEGGQCEMVREVFNTSWLFVMFLKNFTGNSRLLASWRGCLWSLVELLQIWWTLAVDARPAPRWPPHCHIWVDKQRDGSENADRGPVRCFYLTILSSHVSADSFPLRVMKNYYIKLLLFLLTSIHICSSNV